MSNLEPAGMVIERISEAADLDAVAALESATFTNPWTREMLERELRQSDVARVYVVRLPGCRVAAFCACWLVHDELHINTIAVDAHVRRQGLATALMKHLLADAAGSARVAPTSRSAAPTCRPSACTRASASASPPCGATTTASRRRTPWCCRWQCWKCRMLKRRLKFSISFSIQHSPFSIASASALCYRAVMVNR